MIIQAPKLTDFNFDVFIDAVTRVIAAESQTEVVVGDLIYLRSTSAHTKSDFQLSINPKGQGSMASPTIEVHPSGAFSIDSNNFASMLGTSGQVSFYVTIKGLTKRVTVQATENTTNTVDTFLKYAHSYACNFLTTELPLILANAVGTPPNNTKLFTTYNHETQNYVYNSNCWAYDLDLTGVSTWNSHAGTLRYGTLISPRHFIYAKHYSFPDGTALRFVAKDGTVVTRTCVAQINIDSSDICIGLLDQDVPNIIKYYNVLPNDFFKYCSRTIVDHIPVVSTNQWKEVTCRLGTIKSSSSALTTTNPGGLIGEYFKAAVAGDSGNPNFLITNDRDLVVLGCYIGATSCPSILHYYNQINDGMTILGGGYLLNPIDLSNFPIIT